MNIITVGIDLAKNVFAVYGVDDSGKPVLVKPKVLRADLLALLAQLPPCLIGKERKPPLSELGHTTAQATREDARRRLLFGLTALL